MEVFRVSREKYAAKLSGKGAAIRGARWNSVGVEMIYTAANRSLAMAEVAVHLSLATLEDDYLMLTIAVPVDVLMQKLTETKLPRGWNNFPYISATQAIGNKFIADGKHCVMQVPSAVTPGDHNFLINPHHDDFAKIRILKKEPFPFDKRMFS